MTQTYFAPLLFDGEQWHEQQVVTLSAGKVSQCETYNAREHGHLAKEELEGMLAPGFIDVQVNGGGGVLFNHQPDTEGLRTIVDAHRAFGTVALMPTLITDDNTVMTAAHRAITQALSDQPVPGVVGVHYEGPYLNRLRKGVHDEEKIRQADLPFLQPLLNIPASGRVMVTLAPELAPEDFIETLEQAGVLICAGHTAATYAQAMTGFAKGIRGVTHLFNAMSPLTTREPGMAGAAMDAWEPWCGIIVDGHHIHPATLRIAAKAKGTEKLMLVTDAIHSVGMAENKLDFLGKTISIQNGLVTTADGTLAGSNLDMASAVRNALAFGMGDNTAVLQMASRNPAHFLRLDNQLGYLKPGYRASLVNLDENWQVRQTWIDGENRRH
ncbi:N-acetylglucosamine-6-phosphate deacetylase [Pokkaliibacter sp. CJK22405]|uniref:N-acetylglucosamine-6-phosphate deacetylase n=1 Tax=Pokkaliibacter sp. CJK22405 TaxID=3384615 RepID=UPI0039850FCA